MTTTSGALISSRVAHNVPELENGEHLDQPTFHARYKAMSPDFRAELIGGRVFVPSPLKIEYGEIHGIVNHWLGEYRLDTPGVRVLDNATTILGEDSEPQPDTSVFLDGGPARANAEGYLVGPPQLIVEVASSSAALDLFEKRGDYERLGVAEYLVLVTREARAAWFVRPGKRGRNKRFTELPTGVDGVLRSPGLPGLWLDIAALFALDARRLLTVLKNGLASPEHAAFVASHKP